MNENSEYPDFGGFTIDGKDPNTALLATQCEQGSHSWCLGNYATLAYCDSLPAHLHFKAPTWKIKRDKLGNVVSGVIGLTFGIYRYERPMTTFEATMADKFDKTGQLPRRKVTVDLDTSNGRWVRKPKAVGGGIKGRHNQNGQGSRQRHNIRARELQEWREMMNGRGV